jgi:hypothetical protein
MLRIAMLLIYCHDRTQQDKFSLRLASIDIRINNCTYTFLYLNSTILFIRPSLDATQIVRKIKPRNILGWSINTDQMPAGINIPNHDITAIHHAANDSRFDDLPRIP